MIKIVSALNKTEIDVKEGKAQGLIAVVAIALIVLVPILTAF